MRTRILSKGEEVNSEDYAKIVDSTEKVLESVDKEILKLSDAALEAQKLEGGEYLSLSLIHI